MSARVRLLALPALLLALVVGLSRVPPSLRAPSGVVLRIAAGPFWHPDSRRLVGVSADGGRVLTSGHFDESPDLFGWDAATGELAFRVPLLRGGERCENVAVAAEGVRALVGDAAGYRLRVFDPRTGAELRTGPTWQTPWKLWPADDGRDVSLLWARQLFETNIGYSRDGSRVIVPAEGGFRINETDTGRTVAVPWRTPHWIVQQNLEINERRKNWGRGPNLEPTEPPPAPYPTEPYRFDFSPDARLVALVGPWGHISFHSCDTGAEIGKLQFDVNSDGVGFTADGREYLVHAHRPPRRELEAYALPSLAMRLIPNDPLGNDVRFAPDGRTIAHVGASRSGRPSTDWRFQRFGTGEPHAAVPADIHPRRAAFAPDSRTFFTETATGRVVPWDVESGQPRLPTGALLGDIETFRFTPDGLLAGWGGGQLIAWDPLTGRELFRRGPHHRVDPSSLVAFTPRGKLAYSSGGEPALWDFRTGREDVFARRMSDFQFPLPPHYLLDSGQAPRPKLPNDWPNMSWSVPTATPDRQFLAAFGISNWWRDDDPTTNSALARFDAAGGNGVRQVFERFHARAIDLSPDGRFVAASGTANGRQVLKVWDVQTDRTTDADLGEPGLSAVGFAPDGRSLVVAAGGTIRLLEVGSWRVRKVLPNPHPQRQEDVRRKAWAGMARFAFSPDSLLLAAAQSDGGVVVLDARIP